MKEKLIIYWTNCSVTGDLIYSAVNEYRWEQWMKDDKRYHYLDVIEVDKPEKADVDEGKIKIIDDEIAKHRLAIIKCEDEKSKLLSLEQL